MDTTIRHRPLWLLGWVLLSVLGFAIGSTVVFIGGWSAVEAVTGDADRVLEDGLGFFLYLTAAFSLGGLGWATGQWLLLRRLVPGAGRWLLSGAAGFALITVLYFGLYERVPLLVNEAVHNLAGGALMGAIQLPTVLRLTGGRSKGWIGVAGAAMVLGGMTNLLVVTLGGGDDLGGPLGVAAAALLTGFTLSRWMVAARPGDSTGGVEQVAQATASRGARA